MIQFDEHIFQMGWNHQLEVLSWEESRFWTLDQTLDAKRILDSRQAGRFGKELFLITSEQLGAPGYLLYIGDEILPT